MKRKESNVIMLSNLCWFMYGAMCGVILMCILSVGSDDDE